MSAEPDPRIPFRYAISALWNVYDEALPAVYGYLLRRTGSVAIAEDLTSETFLAAVVTVQRHDDTEVNVAWLLGVARHKLIDHWRRAERDEARTAHLSDAMARLDEGPWDTAIDRLRAEAVLAELGGHHRSALTLRYLDALPVAEVARILDRTLHATEALLVRARAAFRRLYESTEETP